jgi:lysyl-tRNA synthetase class 2
MNRNFRNEGISFKHNPEFTMMEIYQAYADYNDMMDLVQDIVCTANAAVNPSHKIKYRDHEIDLTPPWKRVKLLDLLAEKTGLDFAAISDADAKKEALKAGIEVEGTPSKWKIMDEFFKMKIEPHLIQPVIIYDYPRELSPLAKEKPDNPDIVERFEPYIAGQEIGNAFSELNDPLEQKRRFLGQLEERKKGDDEAHQMDEDYVTALGYAMPPTGGLGVGIDRLAAILLDRHTIRDVILFPQLRPEK